jgi:hypothetical protein
MRCFCCHKEGHVKKDYLIWKKILEDEAKNTTPKVGFNLAMIDWDQLVLDVFVITKVKRLKCHKKKNLKKGK